MGSNSLNSSEVRSLNLNLSEALKSMKISLETYRNEVWPELQTSVQKALTMNSSHFHTESYETFYRNVLRVVQSGLGTTLSCDLKILISQHLTLLNHSLMQHSANSTTAAPTTVDAVRYIISFNTALLSFNHAIDFTHLICLRVSNVMSLDDFKKLFKSIIADKHVHTLIPLLADLQLKSFSVDPEVMENLVVSLYSICPEYSEIRPSLFERFIANFNPLTLPDLECHRQDVLRMCNELRNQPNFNCGDQSKKRRLSES